MTSQNPFHPDDFPLDEDYDFDPTKTFYLKGAIHFKTTAQILDLTDKVRQPFDDFSNAFLHSVNQAAQKGDTRPTYEISSCGGMMRTIKTMTDASGEKIADLNITFVSFDSSTVKFPAGSQHSRHNIELYPITDGEGKGQEAFVKNSIPYFWDMTNGQFGVLYKTWNQKKREIGRVAAYGFAKDAIMVLDADELDDVVALSTAIILLNGRDAMDS